MGATKTNEEFRFCRGRSADHRQVTGKYMNDIQTLKKGQILTNADLCDVFQCAGQAGMRRSLKTNTLVLVANHVKSIFDDRWIDDIFHYTGMGQIEDQDINFAQNKTVAESRSNGVDIHLFEVFEDRKYIYQGIVSLADEPYQEIQQDSNGRDRKVWMFPLKLNDGEQPAIIPQETLDRKNKELEKKSKKRTTNELKSRVENAPEIPGVRSVLTKQYERNQDVVELAKRRARGKCELCEKDAPFQKKNGEPFLEVHHVIWLSRRGSDTIYNVVALCPNCHRKMHALDSDIDKKILHRRCAAVI